MESQVTYPIVMNFSQKTLEEIGRYYFLNSLQYYPDQYLPILLTPGSKVPKHVAYLCPICLKQAMMIIDSPSHPVTCEFTEDHYPPKNVGGKKFVLVCRDCNSKAGHDYDFALKDHLTHLSFQKKIPNSKIKSRTIIKDVGNFRGDIMIDEDGQMQLNNGNSTIAPLAKWNEYSKANNDWVIHVRIRTPESEKIEKALIHAAYLTCFEYFGYEYIFSEGGQLMRDVLDNKRKYPASVLDLNIDSEYMLQSIPLGLVFINEPKNMQSLAVNLKLSSKETGYSTIKTVLIPNPTNTGIKDLKIANDYLVKYEEGLSMMPLKNFLELGELPPYRMMWGTLMRDYGHQTSDQ